MQKGSDTSERGVGSQGWTGLNWEKGNCSKQMLNGMMETGPCSSSEEGSGQILTALGENILQRPEPKTIIGATAGIINANQVAFSQASNAAWLCWEQIFTTAELSKHGACVNYLIN